MQRRVPSTSVRLLLLPLAIALLALAVLTAAPSAKALSGFKHATAQSKGACAAGCHAKTTPTNATCTGCHSGYKASGTQKCWDCHKPGQSMASAQLLAGCTTTCHVSTTTGDKPSYTTATYTHAPAVHLGATGYGKTCLSCHAVSTGSAAPGTSPHHDAVNSAAPACAECHDGSIASTPSAHAAYGADCASCHAGMDRPTGDCVGCHTGRPGSTMPQIAYTNTLTCADAACHGKVANHAGTPISSASCTTCHPAHYQTLGTCTTCHPSPQTFHHGTVTARPLVDCAGCHDGTVASARTAHAGLACSLCHSGMSRPGVPAVCSQCHLAKKVGTATCTDCHSTTGMTGREQVHATTPRAGLTCTTCHAGHNADLGDCTSCHGLVPESHHGVAAVSGSTLTLQAEPVVLKPGEAGAVSGTLTGAGGAAIGGAQVLVQARLSGAATFADVQTVATGAEGSFSLSVQPATATEYRAVYRGASSGGTTVQRPALATVTVPVGQSVRLGARSKTARVGARIMLTGVAAPDAEQLGAAAQVVSLRVERKLGRRWVKVASARRTPGAGGSFSWTWRPRKSGTYRVTASLAATAGLPAASAQVKIRVR